MTIQILQLFRNSSIWQSLQSLSLTEFSRGYLSFFTPEQLNDPPVSAPVQEFKNLTQPSNLESQRIFQRCSFFFYTQTAKQPNEFCSCSGIQQSDRALITSSQRVFQRVSFFFDTRTAKWPNRFCSCSGIWQSDTFLQSLSLREFSRGYLSFLTPKHLND